MQAFDFMIQLLNKNMFNGTLKIGFFIDISWRCLRTLIALVVYLIVSFTNFEILELQVCFKRQFRQ